MQISRSYKRHLTAADKRSVEIIKSCMASGAGVDYLDCAPRFRYTPPEFTITSFKGREDAPPSGRGTIPCGRGNVLKLKNWSPSRLDANPMYAFPMKGDDSVFTRARKAWSEGDPQPLRNYLRKQAEERRLRNELFEFAA